MRINSRTIIKRNLRMTSQHSIKFIINPETCSDSYYTTSTFKHIYKLSLAITKIIQKYDIQSITKAIFCLNAWRPNRSILSKTMALNLSLCTLRTTGNIHINTYQDFNLFYNEIHKFLFVDSMDDPIIDDFGEIFINYKGNRCPIITGTGHTQVYSALRYLVTLSDITNRSEELSIILQYLSTIINTLKETNLSSQAINSTFELPSQDFWNSINILFESTLFKEQLSILASILPTQNIPIEHKHFFYYNNKN